MDTGSFPAIATGTDLGGDAFGELGIEVAYRDFRSLRSEPARGRRPQSRCPAGDDGGLILQLHGFPLLANAW